MANRIVEPLDHRHTDQKWCKVHSFTCSQGPGKADGNKGNKGKLRLAIAAGNPLDKQAAARRKALNESSQANVPTLVLRNGKARFVRAH